MITRRGFAVAGLSATALAALETMAMAKESRPETDEMMDTAFDKCARACSDCQRACDACATYCAKALAQGPGHHFETLMSCRDCADFCSTAAQIVARQGSTVELICRACAEACARCAMQCEHHGRQDAMMTRCAQECRRCETACRDMLAHRESPPK